MDDVKQQLADKLSSANNVLITVSRDPSVDQLAALLGLSLLLNQLGKHSAAVFSGKIPSTMEFLKPEETIEKTTDSLRDFIIALDKNKADKLRYKVEDNIVRIFITPYKTSISEDDLDFSQGDFNVDVVVALGVADQQDLDEAITAHGRILHDATVASVNVVNEGGLGALNWHDPSASSLSEMIAELTDMIGADNLDEQIATALLTGIVAETERFSNDKTSPKTMSISANLMAAGANQQLVATQLEEGKQTEDEDKDKDKDPENEDKDDSKEDEPPKDKKPDDGTLQIDHQDDEPTEEEPKQQPPKPEEPKADDKDQDKKNQADKAQKDLLDPSLVKDLEAKDEEKNEVEDKPLAGLSNGPKLVTEPPTMGGTLTANSSEPKLDPVTDPMSLPNTEPPQLLDRKPDTLSAFGATPTKAAPASDPDDLSHLGLTSDPTPAPAPQPTPTLTPPPSSWTPPPLASPLALPEKDETLSQIEQEVKDQAPVAPSPTTAGARDEVSKAIEALGTNEPPSPIAALHAQPLGTDLHPGGAPLPPVNPAVPPSSTDLPPQPPPVPPPLSPIDFGQTPPAS